MPTHTLIIRPEMEGKSIRSIALSAIGMSMPAAIKKERDAKEQARIKAEEARKAKEAEWKAAANKKKGSHQQQKKKK